jgi:hypothetical protein
MEKLFPNFRFARYPPTIRSDSHKSPALARCAYFARVAGLTSGTPPATTRLRVFCWYATTKAVESCVLGLVNHTHPTAAQLLDDAVVRDGLADH